MLNYKQKLMLTKLSPDFVTGLTEAEGSFSIVKIKNIKAKYNVNVGLRFRISMLTNETELLNGTKYFFKCGNINSGKDGTVTYQINDIYSINKHLIPHFIKYPLRGTKYLDFLSFKEALDIINSKVHLTKDGIHDMITISYNMNSYRKLPLGYSPNHTKKGSGYIPINGNYINGFIAGDGCLSLNTKDVGFGRMSLQISQHKNNKPLLLSIANFFNSSKVYYHDVNSLQITLRGITRWENVIFNHFREYLLHGSKNIRLNKLFVIREFMLNGNHLIKEGRYRKWRPDTKQRIIDIWNS